MLIIALAAIIVLLTFQVFGTSQIIEILNDIQAQMQRPVILAPKGMIQPTPSMQPGVTQTSTAPSVVYTSTSPQPITIRLMNENESELVKELTMPPMRRGISIRHEGYDYIAARMKDGVWIYRRVFT